MKKIKALMPEAYDFNGKLPLKQAIPLGLQHVMAMFVGNLTPLLIITGACGIGAGSEYASIEISPTVSTAVTTNITSTGSIALKSNTGLTGINDFGSLENLFLAFVVLVVILFVKHWTKGYLSSSAILVGIIVGYIVAIIMGRRIFLMV